MYNICIIYIYLYIYTYRDISLQSPSFNDLISNRGMSLSSRFIVVTVPGKTAMSMLFKLLCERSMCYKIQERKGGRMHVRRDFTDRNSFILISLLL